MVSARTVYVIESEVDATQYYIGLTSNFAARLAAHNAGKSVHTSKHRPWRVVVQVEFEQPERAIRFEQSLKSHSGRAFLSRHFREQRQR
jgi:putative endonuclease